MAVIARAARAQVVLLGEDHDAKEHHRWQLSVLSALLARRSQIVVGLESLPRITQPVLDEWSAGQLDTAALLARTAWRTTWGPIADEYLPLAHWARLYRQPLVALNASRALVARVGREGWAAVPVAEREGLSDPVPASDAYRAMLARAYAEHACIDASAAATDPRFARFVEAQLTWDRAMAEALVAAYAGHPDALAVGVMGRGHVEQGEGVVRQLRALGVRHVVTLLPWDEERPCSELTRDLATAVFGVAIPADERAAMERSRAAQARPCPRSGSPESQDATPKRARSSS